MNQTMKAYKNPDWWTDEHDDAWNRVKMAMKHDWNLIKHDLGGGADTGKNGGKAAIPAHRETAHDRSEAAYRFGHGARLQYGGEYPEWDQELEVRLQEDWHAIDEARNWNEDREAIHFGWDYDEET
jgi:hypothetical protein